MSHEQQQNSLIAGSVIGHADLTFRDSVGFQGRFHVAARSIAGTSFSSPACELWDRENDDLFRILYYTRNNVAHSSLQQLRPVDESGARGNGQEAFSFLRNRYEGRSEARVRSLLVEMQRCTLQPGEDPAVYFARLHRLRLQPQQVGCTIDGYQLKAKALSGLSVEYIPMLNQLRTMQSLDLTMLDEMLRVVYVNDILPKKAKNLLRYRSEAATTTAIMANGSGKKRDMSELICHNHKVEGHYAKKCPAKKPLPGDSSTTRCSLNKTQVTFRQ